MKCKIYLPNLTAVAAAQKRRRFTGWCTASVSSWKHRPGGELMAVEDLRKECVVVRSEVKKYLRGTL